MPVMMDRQRIPGSKWWKFDFHCHTPASTGEFGRAHRGDDEGDDVSHRDWLLAAMSTGVDCVAITDHNSGAWVDPLKEELARLEVEQPDGFRPIYIFPNAEISVNGNVHVLAILDLTATTDDVSALLGAVGYDGERGVSDGCTTRSFVDVVAEIVRRGGVAIPAHVDGPKGLFQEAAGQSLDQALRAKGVVAMELCDPEYIKPELFASTKAGWVEVVGSDAHTLGQIGSRCRTSRRPESSRPSSNSFWVRKASAPGRATPI